MRSRNAERTLIQRSATRIQEIARSPRVGAAYRQAVATLVPPFSLQA